MRTTDRRLRARHVAPAAVAAALVGVIAWAGVTQPGLPGAAAVTLAVFVVAVWCWVCTPLDDTLVALGAAVALVVTGTLPADALFGTLGDDLVWLLVGAFVISAAVTTSGLAHRATALLVAGVPSARALFHLLTAGLVVTAFAVPSTSGRAALALPVFVALAVSLRGAPSLVGALALLFPTVILLSAVGSLLGAGAHLVTSEIVAASTGEGFGFVRWLVLGLPLAVVSSHLAAELVLRVFTTPAERRTPVRLTVADLERESGVTLTGPLSPPQGRAAFLLVAVVVLWCTEPLHGLDPAVVALVGALAAAMPRFGVVGLGPALRTVPWSLLLFLAATLALGRALVDTGAAGLLAGSALPGVLSGPVAGVLLATLVVVVSTAAHLVIQSRSARSAVLVPVVIALAPAAGLDPAAAAFVSTAAAGFCHTLTSSAKPVAMFATALPARSAVLPDAQAAGDGPAVPTYGPRDLLRLSAWLAPLHVMLLLLFTFAVWPAMGLAILP